MDSSEQAQDALAQLVASWREPAAVADIHAGRAAFDEPAIKSLFEAVPSLDAAGQARLMNSFAEAIDDLPLFEAARLAVIVGTLVEGGFDPGRTLDSVLDRLTSAVPTATGYFLATEEKGRAEPQDADAGEMDPAVDPEGYHSAMAARFFAMAAMSALVRSVSARIAARARAALLDSLFEMEQVGSLSEIYALSQLLRASDEETVVVVCPATRRGAEFKTSAVRNCAHLYTLLDLVIREKKVNLLGGWASRLFGADLDPDEARILEAARGSVEAYAAIGYDAPFAGKLAFGTWTEVDARGAFDPFPFVAVDAPVAAFPRLDGVIVLGAGDRDKHGPKRTWGIAFFDPLHGDLSCDVELQRVLPRSEVDAWMTRICERGN